MVAKRGERCRLHDASPRVETSTYATGVSLALSPQVVEMTSTRKTHLTVHVFHGFGAETLNSACET